MHEECAHFRVTNVLLSPSNCHLSPTLCPWLLGSAVWEKERWRDLGWGGLRGCLLLKEACRSLSRRIHPSSKWDPQQGLLCLRSLFIYSCSPWKKHSPSLSHPSRLPSSPLSLPLPAFCVSRALSARSRMPLENCCSQRSPPVRSGSVNIFNSTCVCACLISLSR